MMDPPATGVAMQEAQGLVAQYEFVGKDIRGEQARAELQRRLTRFLEAKKYERTGGFARARTADPELVKQGDKLREALRAFNAGPMRAANGAVADAALRVLETGRGIYTQQRASSIRALIQEVRRSGKLSEPARRRLGYLLRVPAAGDPMDTDGDNGTDAEAVMRQTQRRLAELDDTIETADDVQDGAIASEALLAEKDAEIEAHRATVELRNAQGAAPDVVAGAKELYVRATTALLKILTNTLGRDAVKAKVLQTHSKARTGRRGIALQEAAAGITAAVGGAIPGLSTAVASAAAAIVGADPLRYGTAADAAKAARHTAQIDRILARSVRRYERMLAVRAQLGLAGGDVPPAADGLDPRRATREAAAERAKDGEEARAAIREAVMPQLLGIEAAELQARTQAAMQKLSGEVTRLQTELEEARAQSLRAAATPKAVPAGAGAAARRKMDALKTQIARLQNDKLGAAVAQEQALERIKAELEAKRVTDVDEVRDGVNDRIKKALANAKADSDKVVAEMGDRARKMQSALDAERVARAADAETLRGLRIRQEALDATVAEERTRNTALSDSLARAQGRVRELEEAAAVAAQRLVDDALANAGRAGADAVENARKAAEEVQQARTEAAEAKRRSDASDLQVQGLQGDVGALRAELAALQETAARAREQAMRDAAAKVVVDTEVERMKAQVNTQEDRLAALGAALAKANEDAANAATARAGTEADIRAQAAAAFAGERARLNETIQELAQRLQTEQLKRIVDPSRPDVVEALKNQIQELQETLRRMATENTDSLQALRNHHAGIIEQLEAAATGSNAELRKTLADRNAAADVLEAKIAELTRNRKDSDDALARTEADRAGFETAFNEARALLAAANASLKDQADRHKDELISMGTLMAAQRVQLDNASNEVARLTAALGASSYNEDAVLDAQRERDETVGRATVEINALREELARLQQLQGAPSGPPGAGDADAVARIGQLTQELQARNTAFGEMVNEGHAKITALEQERNALREQLTNGTVVFERLSTEYQQRVAENAQLAQDAANARDEAQRAREAAQAAAAANNGPDAEIARVSARESLRLAADAEARATAAGERAAASNQELGAVRTQLQQAQATVTGLQENIRAAATAREALERTHAENLSTATEGADRANRELAQARRELADAKRRYEDELLPEANQRATAAEQEAAALRGQIAASAMVDARIKELERQLAAKEAELVEVIDVGNKKHNKDVDALNGDLDRLEAELDGANAANAEKTRALEETANKLRGVQGNAKAVRDAVQKLVDAEYRFPESDAEIRELIAATDRELQRLGRNPDKYKETVLALKIHEETVKRNYLTAGLDRKTQENVIAGLEADVQENTGYLLKTDKQLLELVRAFGLTSVQRLDEYSWHEQAIQALATEIRTQRVSMQTNERDIKTLQESLKKFVAEIDTFSVDSMRPAYENAGDQTKLLTHRLDRCEHIMGNLKLLVSGAPTTTAGQKAGKRRRGGDM